MLQLYVDSADRDHAERLLRTRLFHGLTTNPALLAESGIRFTEFPRLYEWAVNAGAREVFFQTWGGSVGELFERAMLLREIGPQVVVKVPVTADGAAVAARLSDAGVPVLVTVVFNAAQGLVAAVAGADYVAPYLGRMGDAGRDGIGEVVAMQKAYDALAIPTRVLVASVREVAEVITLAGHGVGCFTLGLRLAAEFIDDPLTAAAVETFEVEAAAALDPNETATAR